MGNQVPLGQMVTITGGGTPSRIRPEFWGGNIPWASVKDLGDTTLDRTTESITEEGLRNSPASLVEPGSLIVATRMGLGKAAINTVPLAINQDLKALRCSDQLDNRYLLHFLLSKAAYLESMGKGATVKGFKLDTLQKLGVPLPPLAEQRRIAAVLDKADSVRLKERRATQLTEEFLRSTFLEMFGDPIGNPKGWPISSLGAEVSLLQYGPRFYSEPYSDDGVRIVRITDLNDLGQLAFGNMPRLRVDEVTLKKFRLKPGDLIFARTGATVGKTAVFPAAAPDCIAGAYFIRLQFSDRIDPLYARMVLSSRAVRESVSRKSRQSAQQNFSGPSIRALRLPLPPMRLQLTFARIVERTRMFAERLARAEAETARFSTSLSAYLFRTANRSEGPHTPERRLT